MPDEVTSPIYSERYVAFVDILGFSNIVRHSITSPSQAIELSKALERIASHSLVSDFRREAADDYKGQSFSDCIVISERAGRGALIHLLQCVGFIALDLLSNGILTRGGIAKGKLYHTDKVVFGPALIDAYALESTVARFPRILLDRATHCDFLDIPGFDGDEHLRPRVNLAEDGPPFLDILSPFRVLCQDSPQKLFEIAESCRSSIKSHLDNSIYDPKHYEKLRWLTLYWNGLPKPSFFSGLQMILFPSNASN